MKKKALIATAVGLAAAAGLYRWMCRHRESHGHQRLEGTPLRQKPERTSEAVETASEDSFPASDAPAWTGIKASV